MLCYSLFQIRKLDLYTVDLIYALGIHGFTPNEFHTASVSGTPGFRPYRAQNTLTSIFRVQYVCREMLYLKPSFTHSPVLNRHLLVSKELKTKTIQLHRTRHFNCCLWKVNKYKPNWLRGDESGYPEQKFHVIPSTPPFYFLVHDLFLLPALTKVAVFDIFHKNALTLKLMNCLCTPFFPLCVAYYLFVIELGD